jgi:HK97 family phage major capsid protein
MKSIQALREQRGALQSKARKIMDDSPGASFTTARASEVDKIFAEIDGLDREILAVQKVIDGRSEKFFGQQMQADGIEWRDADTGQKIPVAFANNGSIQSQLEGSFQDKHDLSQPKASMGEFLRGVAGLRSTESVRNALSIGTDSAGGFSLPSYLQLPMIAALAPQSALLTAGAGVSILAEGSKNYRIAAVATIPTAAWRNEGGALATSDPVFRSVDLTPRSLSFQFKISRELLFDSANLEQALYGAISQAFAKELDRAGLRGSGSAPEIRGILNTSGIQAVTNGANGASLATTAYANLIAGLQAILAADGPTPTAAIMSPRSLTTLAGLLDTTNQPRRAPQILDPWKMLATSQIPNNLTVGTSTDCSEIYVGDFSNIVYFMREGVSIQPLNELYAGTGEIGFACHTRVDVGMLYPAALGVITGVRA